MLILHLAAVLASLLEYVSPDYILMNEKDDFPMGMGYDETYNIRKYKPRRAFFKTITTYRLPRHLMPLHYDIRIKPILEDPQPGEKLFTAPGEIDITIKVIDVTFVVTLHVKKVRVIFESLRVTAISKNATKVKVTGHNVDEERNFLTIFLDHELTEGAEYIVHIAFVSKIYKNDELMAGIYTVNYEGEGGAMRIGAVTQFQKDDASRAFPCFDEPDLKAEFTVTVGRKEKYMSFSNMPKVGDPVPINGSVGWVWDMYERAPKYPTYLIAFVVVMDYVKLDTPSSRMPIQTWAPISEKTDTSLKFAAAVSGNILEYFERLFGYELNYKKMDNVAYPQMELHAMEHPGLVTYRSNFLVWKKEFDMQYELMRGITLIAHEYIHQWLGNMATCEWWNDFWLNEGFARYFQFVGADQSGINFRAKQRHVVDLVQWAMDFDEGPETVAIRRNETDKVFYLPFHIEYEKGACILRMMSTMLTESVFLKALRKYIRRFKGKSVTQDELFSVMQEEATEKGIPMQYPIATIIKPYLTKTGFPIILVHRSGRNRIYLTQQRFILHPAANNKVEPGLWYVPIWYITKSNPHFDDDHTPPRYIMHPETNVYSFTLNNTDDWVIVNPNARGYFRVVYDKHLTDLIVKQLMENHTLIPFQSRSQLIDDYFRCAKARYITIGQAMSLTKYLENEDEYIVWTTVLNNFRRVFQRHMETSMIQKFKKFILKKIEPPFKRLGPLKEDWEPYNIIMYSMFFEWICTLDDETCTTQVKAYMKKWMENPHENPILVDIRQTVYCSAVAMCTSNETRNFFIKQFEKTTNTVQRNFIARAFACDRNADNLKILVDAILNRDYSEINTSTTGYIIMSSLAKNPKGRVVLWEAMKKNVDVISDLLGIEAVADILDTFSYYASNKGTSSHNHELLDFIYKYLSTHPNLSKKNVDKLHTAIQRVLDNSFFMDYGYHDVEAFISQELQLPAI